MANGSGTKINDADVDQRLAKYMLIAFSAFIYT
jgi:hypothetical protein